MSLSKSSEMSYNNQIHSTLNLVADPNNNQSPDNQLNEFDPLEELEIPPGPVSHVRIKKVQKDSHKKVKKVLHGDTMQSANDPEMFAEIILDDQMWQETLAQFKVEPSRAIHQYACLVLEEILIKMPRSNEAAKAFIDDVRRKLFQFRQERLANFSIKIKKKGEAA